MARTSLIKNLRNQLGACYTPQCVYFENYVLGFIIKVETVETVNLDVNLMALYIKVALKEAYDFIEEMNPSYFANLQEYIPLPNGTQLTLEHFKKFFAENIITKELSIQVQSELQSQYMQTLK